MNEKGLSKLTQTIFALKVSFLFLMLAFHGALAGYHGIDDIEIEYEPCQGTEHPVEEYNELDNWIKNNDPTYQECDPDDPVHDRVERIFNTLVYVFDQWYEVGEALNESNTQ